MIRFSAVLVAAAVGVLVGGIVSSRLLLVYVAIGLSAAALVALSIGVVLKRAELFGDQPLSDAGTNPSLPNVPVVSPEPPLPAGAAIPLYGQPPRDAGGPGDRPGDRVPAPAFGGPGAPGAPAPGRGQPAFGQAPPPPREVAATREIPIREPAARDWPSRPAPGWNAPPAEPPARETPGRTAAARETPARDTGRNAPTRDAAAWSAPARAVPGRDTPTWEAPARDATRWDTSSRPSPFAPPRQQSPPPAAQPGPSRSDSPWTSPAQPAAASAPAPEARAEPASGGPPAEPAGSGQRPFTPSWFDRPAPPRPSTEHEPAAADAGFGDRATPEPEPTPTPDASRTAETAPEADKAPDGDAPAEADTPEAAGTEPEAETTPHREVTPKADAASSAETTPAKTGELDDGSSERVSTTKDHDEVDVPATPGVAGAGTSEASESAGTAADDGDQPPADSDADEQRQVAVVPGVPRYHEENCILIRFMGDDDLQQMSVREATDAGCTPCRACQPDAS